MNEQIEQLMSQLDAKIDSLNATRTDPDLIADAIANNLQGFVSTIVANFLRSKREEELELAKPRDVIKDPIPIDIVSVSRTAADQIVSALEAAGIGKYNIKINSVASAESDGSGTTVSSGMMSTIMKLAAGAAAVALGAVIAFAGPMVGWIENTFSSIKSAFISFVGFLKKAPVIREVLEFFDIGGEEDDQHIKAVENLQKKQLLAQSNPEQFFRDMSKPDVTSAAVAASSPDFIKTVDKYQDSKQEMQGSVMDNFLQTTTGQLYTQQIIDSTDQQQIVDITNQKITQINRDYDMVFQSGDETMKKSYVEQATTEEGITVDYLEMNKSKFKNPELTSEEAFQQLLVKNNKPDDIEAIQYSDDQLNFDLLRDASMSNMEGKDYFQTQAGLDRLIPVEGKIRSQFDQLVNKSNTYTKETSSTASQTNTIESVSTNVDKTTMPDSPDPVMVPPDTPQPAPGETSDNLSGLQNALEQSLENGEEQLHMLQAIKDGIQQRPSVAKSSTPPIEPEQDDFSAEHVRKQWRSSPLGAPVTTGLLA